MWRVSTDAIVLLCRFVRSGRTPLYRHGFPTLEKEKSGGDTKFLKTAIFSLYGVAVLKYEHVELRHVCYIAMFAAVYFLRRFAFYIAVNIVLPMPEFE